jgi:uncharacterized delta-60 repeat protein
MAISTSPGKGFSSGRRARPLTLLKPSLELLEDRLLLNAGALDQSFGMGGEVTTDFGGTDFGARALLQTDGKIVEVGSTLSASSSRFALARYNPDGSLDASFGAGGKVTSPLGDAADAVLQANGDIVVAGGQESGGQQGGPVVVARYTAGGALDSTFGTGGVVTTGIVEVANAGLAIQADGKIVLATSSNLVPPGIPTIVLQRYNADGTLDATFGSGGKVTDVGQVTNKVLLQPDGKIIIAGTGVRTMTSSDTAFFVKRYDADGSVDQSFQQTVNLGLGSNGAEDLALQADGKIVALGFSSNRTVLVRLNADGSLDAGFGVNGQVLTGAGGAMGALALQQDGDIVLAGISENALLVARYLPDGSLETRFGVAGTASAPFPQGIVAEDVKVQTDGKIVVAGWASKFHVVSFAVGFDTSDFALVRFVGGPAAPLSGMSSQRFVQQLYLDVLARVADPQGLAFWSGLVDRSFATRAQVAAAIAGSHEAHALIVQGLYHKLLLRSADPSGQATWTGFLDDGSTAEQLAAILMGSDEYKNRDVVTPTGFVDALYRDVLHRYADAASVQVWQPLVDRGIPHAAIAAAFLATLESDRDKVEELYHRFLHRPADAAGLTGFVNALQAGATSEQVMAVLLGSDEYLQLTQR